MSAPIEILPIIQFTKAAINCSSPPWPRLSRRCPGRRGPPPVAPGYRRLAGQCLARLVAKTAVRHPWEIGTKAEVFVHLHDHLDPFVVHQVKELVILPIVFWDVELPILDPARLPLPVHLPVPLRVQFDHVGRAAGLVELVDAGDQLVEHLVVLDVARQWCELVPLVPVEARGSQWRRHTKRTLYRVAIFC